MDRGRATPSDHQSFNFHQRSPQPSTHPSTIQGFHRGAPRAHMARPCTSIQRLQARFHRAHEVFGCGPPTSFLETEPHLILFPGTSAKEPQVERNGVRRRGPSAARFTVPGVQGETTVPKAPGDARPGRRQEHPGAARYGHAGKNSSSGKRRGGHRALTRRSF